MYFGDETPKEFSKPLPEIIPDLIAYMDGLKGYYIQAFIFISD